MLRLKPISRVSLPVSPEPKSTVPASVGRLLSLRSETISGTASPARLSTLPRLQSKLLRTLDFDIETVAAGFADPQWVPNRTVAWAYAWADAKENPGHEDRGGYDVTVAALPVADFYDKEARRAFLAPLLEAIGGADVVTGHNLLRFDLPVLNAECLLLGLPPLRPVAVQDTIRVPKAKGFKKGQDNMSHALGVKEEKMPLSWAQWEAAYGEPDLATVKERCASDVRMHLTMREEMLQRGWLRAPRMWRP